MKSRITKYELKATVHKKSDPFGAIVGDDTACCMPFGSGKMNEYLANLGTSIFSIRIRNGNGSYRTIAQSVLTADIDIGEQVTNVIKSIQNGSLAMIHHDSFKKPLVLTCDNIEMARNYRNKEYTKLVEDTYLEFFREYLSIYASTVNMDTNKIIIGTNWTKALTGLKTIPNTFIPASIIGYSDNSKETSYILETGNVSSMSYTKVSKILPEVSQNTNKGKHKISKINVQNVLEIAKLEEEVYDETNLKNGLADIQNEIISNLILCEAQNRPCFMFKISNKDNITQGYIIGYEKEQESKKHVYISDFAVLDSKNQKSASATLLISLLERYAHAYSQEDTLPQIVAEFRESTSYKLIEDEDRLNKLFHHYGLTTKIIQDKVEHRGKETFHNCTLMITRK